VSPSVDEADESGGVLRESFDIDKWNEEALAVWMPVRFVVEASDRWLHDESLAIGNFGFSEAK
jgi:hypothetical protein